MFKDIIVEVCEGRIGSVWTHVAPVFRENDRRLLRVFKGGVEAVVLVKAHVLLLIRLIAAVAGA
jgi:hypothetical protein